MFKQLMTSLEAITRMAFSKHSIILCLMLVLLLDARPGQADPIAINRKISGTMPNDFSDVDSFLISPNNQFVVFTADRDVELMEELYSIRLPWGDPVKISGVFINGGSIAYGESAIAISSDSQRAIYIADQDTDNRNELYSVLIDGSAEPVKLNRSLGYGEEVSRMSISPNGQWVVYLIENNAQEMYYLYSVPITGPGEDSIRLAPDVGAGRRFGNFKITPDSQRVAYNADVEVEGLNELYSVLISGSTPINVSEGLPLMGFGVIEFAIAPTPGIQTVIFRAYAAGNSIIELFANVIDDNTPLAPVELSDISHDIDMRQVRDFAFTSDSQRVVYSADQESNNVVELYSNFVIGGTPVKLSGTLAADVDVDRFTITPNNLGVVWLTVLDSTPDIYHLYSNYIDGSVAEPILLDDLPAGRTIKGTLIQPFVVTPNSVVAVYVADQDTQGKDELYGNLTTGGTSVRLSAGTMQINGDVSHFLIAGNAGVLYIADQETDTVDELYFKAFTGGQPIKLNLPGMNPNSDVITYKLSNDGMSVVYRADLDVDGKSELYLWSLSYPNYLPLIGR